MQRTKLSISVGFLGALTCLAPLFGGYVFFIILVLYILLREENEWLRNTAIKALAVVFSFALLQEVIGLIPSAISLINRVFAVFGGDFSINFLTRLTTAISSFLSLAETVILLLMATRGLHQGSVQIAGIDNFLRKHTEKSDTVTPENK